MDYSGTYATPRLDLGMAFEEHAAGLEEFVGLQILPLFRTAKKAANFSAITRESRLQNPDAKRAPKSNYNRITSKGEDKSYACEEYGLEEPVDDSERSLYASDFDAEDDAVKTLAHALMLRHEQRVATAIFDTAAWTGAALYTDNSSNPWDDATKDIIGQVLAAKEKVRAACGMMPNSLICSAVQLKNMLVNTGIKNQFPGAPLITLEMIRAALISIFGLTKLIVGGAVRNSAPEGAAFTGADVWSDDYASVAVVAEQNAPLRTPCVGRTMLWVPDSPNEITTEIYREEQSRSDIVRARHSMDEVILDVYYAHLMKVDA